MVDPLPASRTRDLYDLTRANHVIQRISPELERTILTVRRRLQAHATPATRYSLIGAPAILAELKVLGIRPLPCERTVERVLERNGLTTPLPSEYPCKGWQAGYPSGQRRESPMAFDEALAGRIRQRLARRKNVEEKKLFGCACFLLGGNVLVGVWKGSLIARVGPDGYEDALLEPHVKEFAITGKPMKGWVVVGPEGVEDDEQLTEWIERAVKFVKTLAKS